MYKKDEIKKAESVDIVDYCELNNINLQSDNERYYRLVEHDSLVIDRRKNIFYWNSKSIGGNVINFVQEIENTSFKGAMKRLLDKEIDYKSNDKVEFVTEPYEYQKNKEVNRFDKARDYLVNERKIDPTIVDDLYQRGLIKQDKYNNVLFLWKEHEHIMGCSEQGVVKSDKYKRGSWKSVQKNSTANYGFSVNYGKPKNLKFFESSIDLLSYATLNKDRLSDTQLTSMEGLKHNTVFNYLSKAVRELGSSPDSVTLCVDNDIAGKEFINKFKNIQFKHKDGSTIEFKPEQPNNPYKQVKWDWNDECKENANKIRKGQDNMIDTKRKFVSKEELEGVSEDELKKTFVGKVSFIGMTGKAVETLYYYNLDDLQKEIKDSEYCGRPISYEKYKLKKESYRNTGDELNKKQNKNTAIAQRIMAYSQER